MFYRLTFVVFLSILLNNCGDINSSTHSEKEGSEILSKILLKQKEKNENTPLTFDEPSTFADHNYNNLQCNGKKCTSKEIEYIINTKFYTQKLKFVNESHPSYFLYRDKNGEIFSKHSRLSPKIIFLGEQHNDPISILDNFSFINALSNNKSLILFEGADSSESEQVCSHSFILRLNTAFEYERLAKKYIPIEQSKLSIKNWELHNNTKHHTTTYLDSLNVNHATCKFWDKTRNINNPTSYEGLKQRNQNMVRVINENKDKYDLIFIVAGYRHLPTGEFSAWTYNTNISEKPKLKDFYTLSNNYYTTTRSIFTYVRDYFDLSEALYVQHKRIAFPQLLPN